MKITEQNIVLPLKVSFRNMYGEHGIIVASKITDSSKKNSRNPENNRDTSKNFEYMK